MHVKYCLNKIKRIYSIFELSIFKYLHVLTDILLLTSLNYILNRYSVDEGLTWKRYNFTDKHIRVYGLLTEPGERTTTFTIFGSYRGYHSWLVVQVNVSNVLGKEIFAAVDVTN